MQADKATKLFSEYLTTLEEATVSSFNEVASLSNLKSSFLTFNFPEENFHIFGPRIMDPATAECAIKLLHKLIINRKDDSELGVCASSLGTAALYQCIPAHAKDEDLLIMILEMIIELVSTKASLNKYLTLDALQVMISLITEVNPKDVEAPHLAVFAIQALFVSLRDIDFLHPSIDFNSTYANCIGYTPVASDESLSSLVINGKIHDRILKKTSSILTQSSSGFWVPEFIHNCFVLIDRIFESSAIGKDFLTGPKTGFLQLLSHYFSNPLSTATSRIAINLLDNSCKYSEQSLILIRKICSTNPNILKFIREATYSVPFENGKEIAASVPFSSSEYTHICTLFSVISLVVNPDLDFVKQCPVMKLFNEPIGQQKVTIKTVIKHVLGRLHLRLPSKEIKAPAHWEDAKSVIESISACVWNMAIPEDGRLEFYSMHHPIQSVVDDILTFEPNNHFALVECEKLLNRLAAVQPRKVEELHQTVKETQAELKTLKNEFKKLQNTLIQENSAHFQELRTDIIRIVAAYARGKESQNEMDSSVGEREPRQPQLETQRMLDSVYSSTVAIQGIDEPVTEPPVKRKNEKLSQRGRKKKKE